jgi:hypothetical protein
VLLPPRAFSPKFEGQPPPHATPQLALAVWRPHRRDYLDVPGIVDSGAEVSVLTGPQARQLGLELDRQSALTLHCANGTESTAYRTARPLTAHVVGDRSQLPFSLRPYVVPDATQNLWGVRDFFRAFRVDFRFGEGAFRLRYDADG